MAKRKNPAGARGSTLKGSTTGADTSDTSDEAFLALLDRFKQTKNAAEIRRLSNQIERAIFHRQLENV